MTNSIPSKTHACLSASQRCLLCIKMIYGKLKVDYKISSVCLPRAILDELFKMHPSHQFALIDRNNKEKGLIFPAREETYPLLSTFPIYHISSSLFSLNNIARGIKFVFQIYMLGKTMLVTLQRAPKSHSSVDIQSFLEFKNIFIFLEGKNCFILCM